jgi:glutamine synthetase
VRFVAATAGNPHGANVELKIIDPSANPYLATLGFLGSALRGIERGLPMPAEVTDNPAGVAEPLPADHAQVLNAFESSSTAADLLTPEVVEGVLAVRRYELTTYGTRPPADTIAALRLAWSC